MTQDALIEALTAFASNPDRSRLERLLDHAGQFIVSHAMNWKSSRLPFADRCRELLTEMFLILREGFDPRRISHPRGILSFVALRLRRLTRPREDRAVPFGLSGDLPDHGRLEFTAGRLELVDRLVMAVRQGVAEADHLAVRRLEFAFLHVSPELAAISRFLAGQEGEDAARRLETDKKRHQGFNRSLRTTFERIEIADWREVLDWSAGERSHLAWRIISFSPAETVRLGEPLHAALESWRDLADPFATAGSSHLELISQGLSAWADLYQSSGMPTRLPPPPLPVSGPGKRPAAVGEPAAVFGTPSAVEEEDVLGQLLGLLPVEPTARKFARGRGTAQPAPAWNLSRETAADHPSDELQALQMYREVAADIRAWWLKLAEEAGSSQERPCH